MRKIYFCMICLLLVILSQKTALAMSQRDKLFKSMNVDSIAIHTDESYFEPLMKFFRMRAKRFR